MIVTSDVRDILGAQRVAQCNWAATDLTERLLVVQRVRSLLVRDAQFFLSLFSTGLQRDPAYSLAAEIFPLAEACRFLALEARALLSPKRLSKRGRPLWLSGVTLETHREPHGIVLIIGPANYPLFLPGVQILQALVAGNAVLVKPGRGGFALMEHFAKLLRIAGLPSDAIVVLDESIYAAQQAIALGVDKIIVTGSSDAGQAVLRLAADHATPVTAELSGDDAAIVLANANVEMAARAICFGMSLNGGNTCIAPRRVFASREIAAAVRDLVDAPVISFDSVDKAVALANDSEYALAATVFGEEHQARQVAGRLRVGVVVINDMIIPTADPRLSFGGRARSGFGKTRGAEGLLEMTVLKTVAVQRSRRLWHLEPPPPEAQKLFLSFLEATHSKGLLDRLKGWMKVSKLAARLWTRR